jgi:hypothetical protein
VRQRIGQLCSEVFRNNDRAGFNGVITTASLLEADETFFLECLDRSNSKQQTGKRQSFYCLPQWGHEHVETLTSNFDKTALAEGLPRDAPSSSYPPNCLLPVISNPLTSQSPSRSAKWESSSPNGRPHWPSHFAFGSGLRRVWKEKSFDAEASSISFSTARGSLQKSQFPRQTDLGSLLLSPKCARRHFLLQPGFIQ